MNTWDEDECNQYVGTDSTIFPSLMNIQDGKLSSTIAKRLLFREMELILVNILRSMGLRTGNLSIAWCHVSFKN